MNLKGRHLLTLFDYTPEEMIYLLDLGDELKKEFKKHGGHPDGGIQIESPLKRV